MRRFLDIVNVFSLFRNYLILEKGVALHLNKLEFPTFKNTLCQICLKLAQWFLRKRLLNFVNVFSLFRHYIPLEKGVALRLNKSPSHKDVLCQVELKLAQWFFGRRWKCKKKNTDKRTDRRTTDNRRSEKLTWAFSSGELKRDEKAYVLCFL